MLRVYTLFIYIGLFLCSALPVRAQEYQRCFDLAMQALEQDSLQQAEAYIRQALQAEPANPHNAFLFSNLGTIQRRGHRYEQALESYTLALNITPYSVPILLNRATLYLEMGRNNMARADYSLVLDVEKDNREALLRRAYICQQERDYKAAEADYTRLLRLEPLSFEGRLGLVTLYQKDGRYQEALDLLGIMLEEHPALASAEEAAGEEEPLCRRAVLLVARAGIEQETNQSDFALADLSEALRLNPSMAEAYLVRGQIYLMQKKKTLARRDFEKAVELGVPRADVQALLAQCR